MAGVLSHVCGVFQGMSESLSSGFVAQLAAESRRMADRPSSIRETVFTSGFIGVVFMDEFSTLPDGRGTSVIIEFQCLQGDQCQKKNDRHHGHPAEYLKREHNRPPE